LETALKHLTSIIRSDDAQAMTEYALILAVILVIVVGGIRLISQSPFFR
jgi:Flp pilus assembly pilin Flp